MTHCELGRVVPWPSPRPAIRVQPPPEFSPQSLKVGKCPPASPLFARHIPLLNRSEIVRVAGSAFVTLWVRGGGMQSCGWSNQEQACLGVASSTT